MKTEHKQIIENIIFIILLLFVCWLTQFICNPDFPDVEYNNEEKQDD